MKAKILVLTLVLFLTACGASRYDDRVAEFRASPAPQGSIIYMGDSITARCEAIYPEFWTDGRVNCGIGGATASDRVSLWYEVIQSEAPSEIRLTIGVNDLYGTVDFKADMEWLISVIDVPLTVTSILPIAYKSREFDIVSMNNIIQELATEYGATYIDLWPVFNYELAPELTTDGVHLSRAGCELFLDNII